PRLAARPRTGRSGANARRADLHRGARSQRDDPSAERARLPRTSTRGHGLRRGPRRRRVGGISGGGTAGRAGDPAGPGPVRGRRRRALLHSAHRDRAVLGARRRRIGVRPPARRVTGSVALRADRRTGRDRVLGREMMESHTPLQPAVARVPLHARRPIVGGRARARRGPHPAWLALAAVIAFGVVQTAVRYHKYHLGLHGDNYGFLLEHQGLGPHTLLQPYNENLSAFAVLLYRAIFAV